MKVTTQSRRREEERREESELATVGSGWLRGRAEEAEGEEQSREGIYSCVADDRERVERRVWKGADARDSEKEM